MPLKKIVVLGPESTGKSTLCEQLSQHYNTAWVPEYAREYLLTHGKAYQYADLSTIAQGQLALEERFVAEITGRNYSEGPQKYLSGKKDDPIPLFIDTNMIVMQVWGEFVFEKCEPWILDQVVSRHYDGYLLCQTDLPWTPDELREYPDLISREKLYRMYKDCMINQHTPWTEISGMADLRLKRAIEAVDKLLKKVQKL
jgi:nicotinamide riboside kinase